MFSNKEKTERAMETIQFRVGTFFLALAATAMVLSVVQIMGPEIAWPFSATMPRYTRAVLLGLAALFCLYMYSSYRASMRSRISTMVGRYQAESLRAHLSELSELLNASFEINLEIDPGSMLNLVAKRVCKCFQADRASIYLRESSDSEFLRCAAAWGTKAEIVREVVVEVGQGVAGWVVESNEPIALNDDKSVQSLLGVSTPGRGIATSACVPIGGKEGALGVLCLSRMDAGKHFSGKELHHLAVFGRHVGATIERAQYLMGLHKRIRDLQEANRALVRSESEGQR